LRLRRSPKVAEEVGTKQRDTEANLAKVEPAVEAALGALNTSDQKDLGACKRVWSNLLLLV